MFNYSTNEEKSQEQQGQEGILNDVSKSGKRRDWRGKKMSSLKMAKTYEEIGKQVQGEYEARGIHMRYKRVRRKNRDEFGHILGISVGDEPMGLYDRAGKRVVNYEKRGRNMKFCGSFLEFAKVYEKLKLVKANFCRVPLCPMCQWRKSLRVFFDTSKIVDILEKREKVVPILLTLTVKNCAVENLGATLDNMFKAWFDLMRDYALNPEIDGEQTHIVKGWFRALEVEYNSKTNEFHPHFHALLFVEESYFKGKYYMKTAQWVRLWRRLAKLDYEPICDVRRVRNTGEKKGIMEVAKYTYKDSSILSSTLSDEARGGVVRALADALHGRRLYAYGGTLKKIAAELKVQAAEKSDLVKVDGSELNATMAKAILRYHWNMGMTNYRLVSSRGMDRGESAPINVNK